MIKRLIWTIWTPMSSVLKKADKLNLSLSLVDTDDVIVLKVSLHWNYWRFIELTIHLTYFISVTSKWTFFELITYFHRVKPFVIWRLHIMHIARLLLIVSPKKFQHLTRAEKVVITRLRIGHTKATKSHISSRGPPTTCQHCGQTLTIKNMLLECSVLQQSCNEYYTADSSRQACIVEFLRETGFFYLIWMAIYPEQLLI